MNELKDFDRVTSVLYPFSGLWKVDSSVLSKAAQRGSNVDLKCKGIMEGIEPEDDEYEGYIDSFRQWAEGKNFINVPGRMFDNELKITGECDGIYENEEGITLFDIKTPVKQSKTWHLQLSAYSHLAKQYGYDIVRLEIVQLSKDGNAPRCHFYEEDFEKFLVCLKLYREFFKDCQVDYLDYL
jgi:hypothetical protein